MYASTAMPSKDAGKMLFDGKDGNAEESNSLTAVGNPAGDTNIPTFSPTKP